MSIQYIRDTYGVPAKLGSRVEYTGTGAPIQGTITGTRNAHIRVRMDGDIVSASYHPTWNMRYLDARAAKGADHA